MSPPNRNPLLEQIPSMTVLLKDKRVAAWLEEHPRSLVTGSLRTALDRVRRRVIADAKGRCGARHLTADAVLDEAAVLLAEAVSPQVREAINATGILLHTGLGRAVYPGRVVEAVQPELRGYCTLAIDRRTGGRIERDELIEPLLAELTGAESATVVNNNAAATLLVLAALAAGREVIVSRGQLIEIGGSFRLPEVMAQSGARLVEVGATNRTHLADYRNAVTPATAAILRAHPSNYRIVGFTTQPALDELAALAHERGIVLIDDLGSGALVDLAAYGLPHEPTVQESIRAGADLVLFSGDKLIGGAQSGIVVGRRALIERLRRHPLMRAVRVDKTCMLVLERTLALFRRPERLAEEHPTYQMLALPVSRLRERAESLARQVASTIPGVETDVRPSESYLGSGSVPTQSIPSVCLAVTVPGIAAGELARRLRLDLEGVFGRIEGDALLLDLRTVAESQLPRLAAALARVTAAASEEGAAGNR
ncbi:MAG TPA: L-seryl-tRNA(Sec) selenium transferase [Verrucomicrobiota bacterium]|nr:L-seryl-tRNA(Sec) selenium transferase [Verrucomicrobiota bacterium]HNU50133.1 L-seryl-tRNA(Sec) selenium transferase [Verrucomicrobiota bacterium]